MQDSPLLPVYRRADILMTHGDGAYLFDDANNRYLDFSSGIAVNSLGHSHPRLVTVIQQQSSKLWHCSNLYRNQPLDEFAPRLVEASGFADKVFFCSSGTEAIECAIKMVRRYHYINDRPDKIRIISMNGAFHGRSTAALSACSHPASREGFEPLLKGFDHVAFHDLDALESAITPHTAAILLEPIQGEGGIREHSEEYLQAVRKLCDNNDILMILDEIQCGYGRTGDLFAFEQSGIKPDIVTIAKGMGGGFPLAACLSTNKASQGMTRGTHGSTYGSNPLACSVGLAILDELQNGEHLTNVKNMGEIFKRKLQILVDNFPNIFSEIRGKGLILGLAIADNSDPRLKYELTEDLRKNGLLVAPAVTNVIRLLPPFIITEKQIDESIKILQKTLNEYLTKL